MTGTYLVFSTVQGKVVTVRLLVCGIVGHLSTPLLVFFSWLLELLINEGAAGW